MRQGVISVDPHTFDGMIRRLSRSLPRRSLIGGSFGASVLAAVGLGEDAKAKRVTAEACIPTGKKCPAEKPRGKQKNLGCDQCCQDYVNTVTNQKGKRVSTCACKPNGVTCGNPAHCCSGLCTGGICGGSQSPSAPVVGCDPRSGLNRVARDGPCTRGGAPCCCQDECVADEGGGTCLAPCGAGTQRCNEQCLPYCQLGEPHQSGCAECVCPPESTSSCTLGSGVYTRPDTCCGANQVCCRQGEIDDPDTINVCCDTCAVPPGTGCAA